MRWNEPPWDELRLDVSTDDDTHYLLVQAVKALHYHSSLPVEQCAQLASRYYSLFTDAAHCERLGIPMRDDDALHAEGPTDLALRIYYHLVLNGDADYTAYSQWRASLTARR